MTHQLTSDEKSMLLDALALVDAWYFEPKKKAGTLNNTDKEKMRLSVSIKAKWALGMELPSE
ncbi:hypothetical protein [Shouchella lehensis]|uniref:Uncharacterized protein n=1 Tax=Shouchella lehensis TaxID=300825 RepID=A0A4Y7WIJ0_9BACI|nr:hypothetical protein [Shouchella lehensis]MBG9785612.1 hypothetical protein [Shouchella lehensis]TES48064.1 hypothetical protein E2L03_13090 [Shouchella lehensis]